MRDISEEQVTKRFLTLPESLQDAIFSDQTANIIRKTCVLRETEDHITTVAKLTGLVLLGYLRPEQFSAEVQKETKIDRAKAEHIAHDVDAEIFSDVRLELKKLYPPTIQTPTIQSPGFTAQFGSPTPEPAREQEKPRSYVIEIPEKFRKNPSAPEPKKEATNQPPAAQTPQEAPPPEASKTGRQSGSSKPQTNTPPQPKEEVRPPSTPQSTFKPIIPLPTFIRSQFMHTPKNNKGEEKTPNNLPAHKTHDPSSEKLKHIITNTFNTPATGNGLKQEIQNPYREEITEDNQKQTGKETGNT